MYFVVFDSKGQYRDEGANWPMLRSVLDMVIAEAGEPSGFEGCPRLEIMPDPEVFLAKRNTVSLEASGGLD